MARGKDKLCLACPNCLEEPMKEPFSLEPCNHVLCKRCLSEIRKQSSPACPFCKGSIVYWCYQREHDNYLKRKYSQENQEQRLRGNHERFRLAFSKLKQWIQTLFAFLKLIWTNIKQQLKQRIIQIILFFYYTLTIILTTISYISQILTTIWIVKVVMTDIWTNLEPRLRNRKTNDSIQSTTYSEMESGKTKLYAEDDCPICKDSPMTRPYSIKPCNHVICMVCLITLLETGQKCPNCRGSIEKWKYEREHDKHPRVAFLETLVDEWKLTMMHIRSQWKKLTPMSIILMTWIIFMKTLSTLAQFILPLYKSIARFVRNSPSCQRFYTLVTFLCRLIARGFWKTMKAVMKPCFWLTVIFVVYQLFMRDLVAVGSGS